MRPQLGVESGRMLFRAAVSDTPRPDGPVRDAVERFLPEGSPAEIWRAARAGAVEFVGGTTKAEAAVLPIVVEDGVPIADVEARRIAPADALLANWAAVSATDEATAVLLVHVGETETTARLVRFRPGAPLADLAAGATALAPAAFGLQNAVGAILDSLCSCHHDRVRPTLDASMLRAVLEYGLALQAAAPEDEVRWRGPYASRLWQPLELSPREYFAVTGNPFAPMVEEAARLAAKDRMRVVIGGAGAFFPDAVAAFAECFERASFAVDPSGVARGAARWRETSTVAALAPVRPQPVVAALGPDPAVRPPWSR